MAIFYYIELTWYIAVSNHKNLTRMRILVACEYSGRVREAFARLGHEAMSCDLLPTEQPGRHHQGDVMAILTAGWDLLIGHPPCTFLTNAQSWTFYHPGDKELPVEQRRPHPKFPNRREQQNEAIAFFKGLWTAPIKKICIENPVPMGRVIDHVGPYTQTIQPYMFGEDASKRTCLWLKGLPPLKPTNYIRKKTYSNQTPSGQNKIGPSPDRWKERSRTYQGIADAMAQQWGGYGKELLLF